MAIQDSNPLQVLYKRNRKLNVLYKPISMYKGPKLPLSLPNWSNVLPIYPIFLLY